jgi:hypothetical protein
VAPSIAALDLSLLYLRPVAGTPYLPRCRGNGPPLWVTAHASCRRADALAVGMFDEAFKGYGGEDLDLGQRLGRAGIRVRPGPELVVFHQAHAPAPDRRAQADAADRRIVQKHFRAWRVLHAPDPPDDPLLARRVIRLLRAPELRQYRMWVRARGAAAAELRRNGLLSLLWPEGPAAGKPDLVHHHTHGGEVNLPASADTPALVTGGDVPAGRSPGMDAKLWYDTLLCGACYPGLAVSASEDSQEVPLVRQLSPAKG